jgi:hypothetical protein
MDPSRVSLDAILPHTGRMRLVEALEEVGGDHGRVRIPVRADSPFMAEGEGFKASWCVELLAQGVACFVGWGWLGKPDKPGEFGYVVAVDALRVDPLAQPEVGDVLHVNVRREFELPPAGIYAGEVLWRGRVLASGTVKTFVENGKGFMGGNRDDAQTGPRHGR